MYMQDSSLVFFLYFLVVFSNFLLFNKLKNYSANKVSAPGWKQYFSCRFRFRFRNSSFFSLFLFVISYFFLPFCMQFKQAKNQQTWLADRSFFLVELKKLFRRGQSAWRSPLRHNQRSTRRDQFASHSSHDGNRWQAPKYPFEFR